jgi:hypothetical protein
MTESVSCDDCHERPAFDRHSDPVASSVDAESMPRRVRIMAIALLALADTSRVCQAGIIVREASGSARIRLMSLSFFLACFVACVWAMKRIWNGFVEDIPQVPRLTTARTIGLALISGLLGLFGLMPVPGAHSLVATEDRAIEVMNDEVVEGTAAWARREGRAEQARRDRLENLGMLIRHYAARHDGNFPAGDRVPEIPPEAWQLPDPSGMRYRYATGRGGRDHPSVLAYEPGLFGRDRLVLMTDGTIRTMGPDELEASLSRGAK